MALPLPVRYRFHENKSVQKAVDRAAPNNLRSAGAYVRAIAMRSISTRRPKKFHANGGYEVVASLAGHPPFDHGQPIGESDPKRRRGKNFKKSILFALTSDGKTAVVGPRLMHGGLSNIARLHEFGGRRMIPRIDFDMYNNGPKIGDYGMLRESYLTKKDIQFGKAEVHRDPRTGQRIIWAKIRTKRQRDASSRLYRRYMKKYAKMVVANYPPRPYMAPALQRALPKLAVFWHNSVKP